MEGYIFATLLYGGCAVLFFLGTTWFLWRDLARARYMPVSIVSLTPNATFHLLIWLLWLVFIPCDYGTVAMVISVTMLFVHWRVFLRQWPLADRPHRGPPSQWVLKLTLVFISLSFLLRTFVVDAARMPLDGMLPTISDGSLFWVQKTAYAINLPFTNLSIPITPPKRGDIVAFTYVRNSSNLEHVGRIVGMPGEKVRLLRSGIGIDGRPIPIRTVSAEEGIEDLGTVQHGVRLVPEPLRSNDSRYIDIPLNDSEYLLIGDNRSSEPGRGSVHVIRDYEMVGRVRVAGWGRWLE